MNKRKTKLVRMYTEDVEEIQSRFPGVSMPNFIRMNIKTNPFIQVEALLRGKRKNDKG